MPRCGDNGRWDTLMCSTPDYALLFLVVLATTGSHVHLPDAYKNQALYKLKGLITKYLAGL